MSLDGTYDPDNIFGKILRGEMPSARVFEDDHVYAFMDVFPQSRGHTLVIPKQSSARNLLEEEPRVLEMRGRIVEQKAARDLAMAQYYDNHKYYGAARRYYNSVIENYSQTRPAEVARKRLEEIKGEPDVPPQRFAWLTRLFERER